MAKMKFAPVPMQGFTRRRTKKGHYNARYNFIENDGGFWRRFYVFLKSH